MNETQRRAWHALDIGPAWVARPAVAPEERADRREERADEREKGTSARRERPDLRRDRPGEPAVVLPARPVAASLGWQALREAVAGCRACRLCETRRSTVFGVGDEQADWMVIGEAPGAEEDRRGEPFVGKAGRLLDAMLAAVGRSRERGVFIANVLKCRPPGNRDPAPDETASCRPFLQRQIELVAPKILVAVGRIPAQALLGTDAPLATLRGRVHEYDGGAAGTIPLVVTYHPAYLLRTPLDKAKAWADLQLARRLARE